MITKYSKLHLAATPEEQRKKFLEIFSNRAKKREEKGEHVQFDPDVVVLDIERWQTAKRKNNPNIKSIEQYKTHEELNRAKQSNAGFQDRRGTRS